MKNRKLKIAEFIDYIQDGQDSSLMTIQGGTAKALTNDGACKNNSEVCAGSINMGACQNKKNKCGDSDNRSGCSNIITDPDSLIGCSVGVDFLVVCF